MPSNQRLEPVQDVGIGVHDRLVVHHDLSGLDGVDQRSLDIKSISNLLAVSLIEDGETGLGPLGPIHGGVGIADQAVSLTSIAGLGDGHANAGRHQVRLAIERNRFFERFENLFGRRDNRVAEHQTATENYELIATESSNNVGIAHRRLQPVGNNPQ